MKQLTTFLTFILIICSSSLMSMVESYLPTKALLKVNFEESAYFNVLLIGSAEQKSSFINSIKPANKCDAASIATVGIDYSNFALADIRYHIYELFAYKNFTQIPKYYLGLADVILIFDKQEQFIEVYNTHLGDDAANWQLLSFPSTSSDKIVRKNLADSPSADFFRKLEKEIMRK